MSWFGARVPGPARTAEEATPGELRRAGLRLGLSLAALVVVVVPLIRGLPLGQTTRTAMLAWLLVGIALYWLWAGMGVRPLLLLQLALFSTAAALLTTKILLVGIGVHRWSILRRTAKTLVLIGAGCAGINLALILGALLDRRPPDSSGRVH